MILDRSLFNLYIVISLRFRVLLGSAILLSQDMSAAREATEPLPVLPLSTYQDQWQATTARRNVTETISVTAVTSRHSKREKPFSIDVGRYVIDKNRVITECTFTGLSQLHEEFDGICRGRPKERLGAICGSSILLRCSASPY